MVICLEGTQLIWKDKSYNMIEHIYVLLKNLLKNLIKDMCINAEYWLTAFEAGIQWKHEHFDLHINSNKVFILIGMWYFKAVLFFCIIISNFQWLQSAHVEYKEWHLKSRDNQQINFWTAVHIWTETCFWFARVLYCLSTYDCGTCQNTYMVI